jgi:hypothetical protein
VDDGDVEPCKQRDLVRVDLDAVRAHETGAEHVGEPGDAAHAGRGDQEVAVRGERPAPVLEPLVLGGALAQVGADRDPERQAPAVDVGRAGVWRVRRDADPDELALLDPRAQRRESLGGDRRVGAEHLEVDDRAQPELAHCGGRGAGEAEVGGRRDPCRQRVGRALAGDRELVARRERALARDMYREPVAERLAVAEPPVHRVLEMGVGVDDPGDDHRTGVVSIGAARCDLHDRPVAPGDERILEWGAVDREHPVGGHRVAHVSSAACNRAERRSSNTDSQIEISYSTHSGATSRNVVTGSTPGRQSPTTVQMK